MPEIPAEQRPRREPSHPGAILREDVLPALGLGVSEAARQLRVSRQMLHAILAEREGVSMNQIIATAVAEKLSALMTEDYLEERFEAVLRKVPDIEPEDRDRLG